MKQKYVKPQFLAESFSLSQSVAAGCGINAIPHAQSSHASVCAWRSKLDIFDAAAGIITGFGDGQYDTIFNGAHCQIVVSNDAESMLYDVCYNNPDGSLKAFNS